jgi:predicted nucleotide-binding protein
MQSAHTQALEAVSACRQLVEDYSRRIDEACVEYHATGRTVFPTLSRAEDEDTTQACERALQIASAVIPDAQAQWDGIKYPSNQYSTMVERMRAIWVRRRNLFRLLETILATRCKALPIASSAIRETVMPEASTARTIIVHGHDERNLLALKDILVSKLKLPEPVIMAQQMVPGASLSEKFERLGSRVDFAVALLTPDDVGRTATSSDSQPRPRQDTLVEIGWFWGRLGREHILLLVKKELELPSDLQGVEYHRFESKVEEVTEKIRDFFAAHSHR